MYLRIEINPMDQPYQRILWGSLKQNEIPLVLQFTRVVFGSSSSPFHAQFVSQEHAKKKERELPEAAETILCSTYMDDSMDSKINKIGAIKLYHDLSKLWEKVGIHARKRISSSMAVNKEIPEND